MAQARYSDNPIVSGYPDYIYSGSTLKKCDTHFRVWMQIARAFDDADLPPVEKALTAISLSGIEHTDTIADLEGIKLFLQCGNDGKGASQRVIDYDVDAGRIIASFIFEYGIDLTARDCHLHWWMFCELLRNLSDKSALMRAVQIRTMKLPDGKDQRSKDHRDAVIKAKRELSLPARTAHERRARDKEIWGD